MPRKKFPPKLVEDVFNRRDNPSGVGNCWHCGIMLVRDNRKSSDGFGAWHVDHHPVIYKDIENQCCWGVVDPLDRKNLVPSCVACNISHRYERSHCIFCNHSQIPCTWECWCKVAAICIGVLVVVILGMLVFYFWFGGNGN